MQIDIAGWLEGLGLAQYAAPFAENHVDGDTLAFLTDTDLAELGVRSVGHRRKLRVAIDALAGSSPASTPHPRPSLVDTAAAEPPPPRPAAGAPAESSAAVERRPLCVLCCDFVSGPEVRGLDLEAASEVTRQFRAACEGAVRRLEGRVVNFLDQGVLAYFGWPQAHEDDAERAVRTGLRLVAELPALDPQLGFRLGVRVGIACGPVVMGDVASRGPAGESMAVGATLTLAMRLLQLAQAGEVVTDESTRRLLGRSFEVRALDGRESGDIALPVDAYSVSAEAALGRFEARVGDQVPPMVGRENELALLMERWKQVCAGEGMAVLLVGEAGLGKSRLARALLDACAGQPHSVVRWQCSPYHAGSPLWPVVAALSEEARVDSRDSADEALDKLEALVGEGASMPLYAGLLGLDASGRYGPLDMPPEALRGQTLEMLADRIRKTALAEPMLVLVEDAHWVDPTTLELIDRCLASLERLRLLILVTSRPDGPRMLMDHPGVAKVALNRLTRASVEAMVARMSGAALQKETLAKIVSQTDGVPLFIEELTKSVLESGGASIPASLHGTLIERLDRIPEVKEVAQAAACIGREFDASLLAALVDRPAAVDEALDKLVAAELVFRQRRAGRYRYTFKHALVQEAAHESLLRGRRAVLHGRLLELLQQEGRQAPPEVLAHHAMLAGDLHQAAAWWRRAGDVAFAMFAYAEAIGHFEQALRIAAEQADAGPGHAQEIDMNMKLGVAFCTVVGGGSPQGGKAFARAAELLRPDDDPATLVCPVRYGLWSWQVSHDGPARALESALSTLAAAQADGRPQLLFTGHRIVGASYTYVGRLDLAFPHLEKALRILEALQAEGRDRADVPASSFVVCANFAVALALGGRLDESKAMCEKALAFLAEAASMDSRILAHYMCGLASLFQRDVEGVVLHGTALRDLVHKYKLGSSTYRDAANALLAWADLERGGRPEQAIAVYSEVLKDAAARSTTFFVPAWMAFMGKALASLHRHEEAMEALDAALQSCSRTSQGWCFGEIWRIRAEVLLSGPGHDDEEVRRCFGQALEVARAGDMKLMELRSAVGLARFERLRGQAGPACRQLQRLHEGFPASGRWPDVRDAEELLAQPAPVK